MRRVPVSSPGRIEPEELESIRAAVERVFASGSFVGGHFVEAFEEEFAASIGEGVVCVGVGSGHDALVLALTALDLPPGRSVIVPPNDGGFAAGAVQSAGLRPVQADCASSGLVGLRQVEQAWGDDVAAVIVTHLHGLVADVGPIQRWCHGRGVRVVEDCAQAHGAPGIAAYADVSTFSFYPTKNLGAMGDGGAVVTPDLGIARTIQLLRQYGWGARFRIDAPEGRNSRLDSVQAAVLSARLPFLPANNDLRRAVVSRYAQCAPSMTLISAQDDAFVAHHAVVVDPDRDALRRQLSDAGIDTDIHYPLLVSEMPGVSLARAVAPENAGPLRDRILSLPCFPTMRSDEVDTVCEALTEWAGSTDA